MVLTEEQDSVQYARAGWHVLTRNTIVGSTLKPLPRKAEVAQPQVDFLM